MHIGQGFLGSNFLDLRRGIFIGHAGDGGQACPNGYFLVLDLTTARIIPIPDNTSCKEDLGMELTGSAEHPAVIVTKFGKLVARVPLR